MDTSPILCRHPEKKKIIKKISRSNFQHSIMSPFISPPNAAVPEHTPPHHHTHTLYLATFQPPTSKVPSALWPCGSLRNCSSSHAEKVTVCVCECLPVCALVPRLFCRNVHAKARQKRGITTYLNLQEHSLFSFFFLSSLLFFISLFGLCEIGNFKSVFHKL